MSYQQSQDMYHDNPSARSPGSQRHPQTLHRQPSRQFDAYGPMPVNLYEDPMARYDTARLERLNPSLNNSYAYDLGGSQTWNPNGFANAQTLGGIRSASASLKSTTRSGRAGLPTVRLFCYFLSGHRKITNLVTFRPGWISNPASRAPFPLVLVPVRSKAVHCAQKLPPLRK